MRYRTGAMTTATVPRIRGGPSTTVHRALQSPRQRFHGGSRLRGNGPKLSQMLRRRLARAAARQSTEAEPPVRGVVSAHFRQIPQPAPGDDEDHQQQGDGDRGESRLGAAESPDSSGTESWKSVKNQRRGSWATGLSSNPGEPSSGTQPVPGKSTSTQA